MKKQRWASERRSVQKSERPNAAEKAHEMMISMRFESSRGSLATDEILLNNRVVLQ